MDRRLRWVVAWTVTLLVCIAITWVAGALVLSRVMGPSDARWVVASGFGVAAAALAALWGHRFAIRETEAESRGKSVTASGNGSIAIGGDLLGRASTRGHDISAGNATAAGSDDAVPGNGARQITASGPNSIAVGGDVTGTASTGDDIERSGA